MNIELLVENSGKVFIPITLDGIVWSTERQGAPGQLTFDIIKDDIIWIDEGNVVRLRVNGQNVFYGYVFTKKRDKENIISITAYDQMRYMKNKYSYVIENKTTGEFIKEVASDFKIATGILEDTGYKIASQVADNTTLLDIIQTTLDLTLDNTQKIYVMYDDFGSITLKNISAMKVDIIINAQMGENFDYSSSIDSDTYNQIVIYEDTDVEGVKKHYPLTDEVNIKKWGVLQLYSKLEEGENIPNKLENLLTLHNKKTRSLSISNVFGDLRVRAGSMVNVMLDLGDISMQDFMLVEKCKHTFSENEHFMDLTLKGGEFIA